MDCTGIDCKTIIIVSKLTSKQREQNIVCIQHIVLDGKVLKINFWKISNENLLHGMRVGVYYNIIYMYIGTV